MSTNSTLTKYRWLVCALLFLATTIIYIDRQIIALVKPTLDKQWGPDLAVTEIQDLPAFAARLQHPSDDLSAFLAGQLPPELVAQLAKLPASGPTPEFSTVLVTNLNAVIRGPSIYDEHRFAGVTLSPATRTLLDSSPKADALAWLNRFLLRDAYPQNVIKKTRWDYKQYGYITSLFQGAYAIGLLGFGWFIDRYGTKIGYATSIILWGIAAMSHGLVSGVVSLRWVRCFVGVSEAGNFPCAIKAVAHWFPRKERAYATTLFNSGANIGPVIAPAIIPPIILALGWRAPFIIVGLVGILWAAFWLWFYANDPSQHPGVGADELAYIKSDRDEVGNNQQKVPWRVLLRYPQTWSFIVAKFLTDPVWWFFLYFLPDYFNKTKNLDLKAIGFPLVALYLIVSVFAIGGGWLTSFLIRKGWDPSNARKVCMLGFAFCVVPVVFVKGAGLWGAVWLIGIAAGAHQAWSANLFTTVSDMFPKRAVASTVGLGGMAGSVGGLLFPLLAGRVLDSFKDKGNINLGYGILFGICAGAYLVAFGLNHLLAPKFAMITLADDQAKA
jgi:ACS family hexuronate transporter-like MFS transporter